MKPKEKELAKREEELRKREAVCSGLCYFVRHEEIIVVVLGWGTSELSLFQFQC
jgi:hypothetical protein